MTRSSDNTRRLLGSRRGVFGVAAALLTAVTCCLASVPPANASTVPVGQALAILLNNHVARTSPSMSAHPLVTVVARRPLTGTRTVLPVLGHAKPRHGRTWIDVRLPGRPNGSTGWIRTDGTEPSWTPWRLSVDLSARVVTSITAAGSCGASR